MAVAAAAAAAPKDGTEMENTGTEVETSAVKNVVGPNGNGDWAVPVVAEKEQQE